MGHPLNNYLKKQWVTAQETPIYYMFLLEFWRKKPLSFPKLG